MTQLFSSFFVWVFLFVLGFFVVLFQFIYVDPACVTSCLNEKKTNKPITI